MEFNNSESSDKQQKWDEAVRQVDKLHDKLGEPVDENIKNTVVSLIAIGFITKQSCEGHIDHGLAYPWVDIGFEDQEDEKEEKTQEQLLKKASEMVELLNQFYSDRIVDYKKRLIVRPYIGRFRLESAGGFLQDIEDSNKRNNLQSYQMEMSSFAAFLKDKYFM